MCIEYEMAIMAANDYIKSIDDNNKMIVLCRYNLMLNAIKEYNETCNRFNNSAPLVLNGGVGEPFSLTLGKQIGR